jgi:hypothetical protein
MSGLKARGNAPKYSLCSIGLTSGASRGCAVGLFAAAACLASPAAQADEGGVSFWVPGFFGSLAASPLEPGFSQTNIYYHTSVSAGANVALAREFQIGRVPLGLNANLTANVNATGDLGFVLPTYTFKTPMMGAQVTVGMLTAYGRVSTSLAGTLAGTITGPAGGVVPFGPRSDSISDSVWGFGDVIPLVTLRWNAGVNNYMVYAMGDVPVGAYDSTRLSNIGIGHGVLDFGGGYTYLNPQTGDEFSVVTGFTFNYLNNSTQYQNGVDMHIDWGTSHFFTKQVLAGLVGYVYKEIGCDSGTGDRVGCFQSQVVGIGPQIGFIFPVGDMQGYLNLKGYKEFAAENRPSGWNTWVSFTISPAPPTAAAPRRPMLTK